MKLFKKISAFFLIVSMLIQTTAPIFAAVDNNTRNIIENTARFILKSNPTVEVGSIGGEWAIIGLARSEYPVSLDYFTDYYAKVEQYVETHKGELHDKKYTEYSRIILAVTAIGKGPYIAGYNLLVPLGDFNKTIGQGINGPIFALIALDSGSYEMPKNPTAEIQATREMYVSEILSRQLADGGFALSGNTADADVTGMALQALSKYQDLNSVKKATDKAIDCLSLLQDEYGGFSMWNSSSSESTAQVFMALCELGIDIMDSRFVKNGNTILDNLLSYYEPNQGFKHMPDGSGVTGMSTEQCFYALVNYQRVASGKTSLYRMSDAETFGMSRYTEEFIKPTGLPGLPGKIADISVMPPIYTGHNKNFSDIIGHANQDAIEALALRGIVIGFDEFSFDPQKNVTRAEFATIMVRALALPPMPTDKFSDSIDKWFTSSVGTLTSYGIASGKATDIFAPNDNITRQEAAVMIANAAKLCGINTNLDSTEIRNILAQFPDYTKSADWARSGLALCYRENILSQDVMEIKPSEPLNRGEIAEMVYYLLIAAKLL